MSGEGCAFGRQRDGADDRRAVSDERDVHGPVGPPRLAELACAVKRVDDPDATGVQPARVRRRFLRQPRVMRELVRERRDEELMRAAITLGANLVRNGTRVTNPE